jgi:hypothetical protein
MDSKQKKELLNSFSAIEYRIKELAEELESIEANINNGANSKTMKEMKRIANLIDEEKFELKQMQLRVMLATKNLSDITERRIIHLKYIGKKEGLYHKTLPLWKIANELGYSLDRINHIHGDALRHLEL